MVSEHIQMAIALTAVCDDGQRLRTCERIFEVSWTVDCSIPDLVISIPYIKVKNLVAQSWLDQWECC